MRAAWIAMTLVAGLVGCTAAPPTTDYPSDFAMSLLVDTGPERWVYHLHPDRDLHAASGAGAGLDTHPPRTARLTHDQMAKTYRLARAAINAPPGLATNFTGEIRIELTYGGRLQAVTFHDQHASDALSALIQQLTALRGGAPGNN